MQISSVAGAFESFRSSSSSQRFNNLNVGGGGGQKFALSDSADISPDAVGKLMQEKNPELFKRFDGNQDGALDQNELESGMQDMLQRMSALGGAGGIGGGSGGLPGLGGMPDSKQIGSLLQERDPDMFMQLDLNQDGSLDDDEMSKGKDLMQSKMAQMMGGGSGGMFGATSTDNQKLIMNMLNEMFSGEKQSA